MKCSILEVQPQSASVCMTFIKGRYTDTCQLNVGVGKSIQVFFYIASLKRPLSLRPTWFRVEYQKSNDEPVVHVASVTCQTNWLGTETYQMLRRRILAPKRKSLQVKSNKQIFLFRLIKFFQFLCV